MRPRTVEISLSERQRTILESFVRNKASTPHRLIERCRIMLMSAEAITDVEQGRQLGVDRQRIRRWRQRWAEHQDGLAGAEREEATDKDLAGLIRRVLTDVRRPGGPTTFSAEQITRIITVACESPEDSGRPVTHWTPRELADEVIKRGIVETISPRHVDRFLKRSRHPA